MSNEGRKLQIASPSSCNEQQMESLVATQPATDRQLMSLKAAAQQVISRNKGGKNSATLQEIPVQLSTVNITAESVPQQISLAELEDMVGEEWPLYQGDHKAIAVIREIMIVNKMIQRGERPSTFIFDGLCKECGPIKLDFMTSGVLDGCPWCHRPRLRGEGG